MSDYILIIVTIALMIWLSYRFKLIEHGKTAISLSLRASQALRDQSLSDHEKERQSRQVAKQLMIQFGWIMLSGGGALLLPLLPLYALSALGLINLEQLFDILGLVDIKHG